MPGTSPINGTKVRIGSSVVYAPYAGAITAIPVVLRGQYLTNRNYDHKFTLPSGMQFKLNSIQVATMGTVTSDPQISIGTAAGGTQIVAGVNLTSNLGSLTLKATTLSGDTYIRIATDTGDSTGLGAVITAMLIGHWQAPPTAMYLRNANHF